MVLPSNENLETSENDLTILVILRYLWSSYSDYLCCEGRGSQLQFYLSVEPILHTRSKGASNIFCFLLS